MNFLSKVRTIVWKDFTHEFRSKEMLISMCVFAFLVIIIFNFAFPPGVEEVDWVIPGILWVAFLFSGLLGMGRSFGAEKDKGSLQGLMLCPVERGTIYVGKMVGNFVFMSMMEAFTLVIFTVLFNVDLLPVLLPLILVIVLGTFGFTVVGTIFSAMSANTRARDVMLSLLVFPIAVPLIIASIKATGKILDGKSLSEIYSWLKILVAFDLTFILVSYLTFEFVLEE
ncbi:MAG: ABC transporter permease [Proteobacteria bacterium]|nr:ABC transporter permease [Pseudomonadota bacterium]